MSTIKLQNIYETTNFFMNYFLSRTGVIHVLSVQIYVIRPFAFLTGETNVHSVAQKTCQEVYGTTSGSVILLVLQCQFLFGATFLGGDAKYTSGSFSIILGTRIGDNLNVLHVAGRHTAQCLFWIASDDSTQSSVHINLELRGAVYCDIVPSVHTHHRDLAQYVQHAARLCLHIIAYLVSHLVGFEFDYRSLMYDVPQGSVSGTRLSCLSFPRLSPVPKYP